MNTSMQAKPALSVLKPKQREDLVVKLGCPAKENQRIPMHRPGQRCHDFAVDVFINPNFNLNDTPIRVIRIHVIPKTPNAFSTNRADGVLSHVTDNQRRDNAFPVDKRIHHHQYRPIFRLQQRTDNLHTSPIAITESETGLGLPNEIRYPHSDQEKIDLTTFGQRVVIVIPDDDNDNGKGK